jgi:hypothetical protein
LTYNSLFCISNPFQSEFLSKSEICDHKADVEVINGKLKGSFLQEAVARNRWSPQALKEHIEIIARSIKKLWRGKELK